MGWRGVSRSGDGRCSPSTTMLRSLKDEYLLFLYTVGQSHVDTPLFLLLFFFFTLFKSQQWRTEVYVFRFRVGKSGSRQASLTSSVWQANEGAGFCSSYTKSVRDLCRTR